MTDRPRVLIEDWLPVTALGIESRRERAVVTTIPALNSLHVWWARRPLVAAAAAVLGSLLPSWSVELADAFPNALELQTAKAYSDWFLQMCGVHGDPIVARRALDLANAEGRKLVGNGYGYKQAYKNSPTPTSVELLHSVLCRTWGSMPCVIDPTAGGGSIPYEAVRYGIPAIANDLNSVAVAILEGGVRVPAQFGPGLAKELQHYGDRLLNRLSERLTRYFEVEDPSEQVIGYIFARTIRCPRTNRIVPLAPSWWLSKDKGGIAAKLITERNGRELDKCEFAIVSGQAIDFDPDQGTIARGTATSPWDGLAISGDYIKAEAQAGRMASQLYAIAVRNSAGRGFRSPTATDLVSLDRADVESVERLPYWRAEGIIPEETRYLGPADRAANYGVLKHDDFFSQRQTVVHCTFVEEYRNLVQELAGCDDTSASVAVLTLLGFLVGKATNWNSMLSSWNVGQQTMRSVFDRHDFSFKWTYAEFEGSKALYGWALDRLIANYEEIAGLLHPAHGQLITGSPGVPGAVSVLKGTAGDLSEVASGSQTLVCIDPPYYDNVMYAELADFFYVWEKRTVGLVHPEWFEDELCDKTNEAIANEARFADAGRRRKALATADYEAKMTAIFAECNRVLRDDGVLTVMFTHKRAEAWDTLGMSLMEAGFTLETSWPVNTEKEESLHQAGKNAAASTIFLVCRKRYAVVGDQPFFEDIEADVRAAAREALTRFSAMGVTGVDLLLSTYGPALSVISSRWPVYSSEADPLTGHSRLLRPEEALDAARAEVVRLQRRRLVGKQAQLDPMTDFALIAWDTFKAAEFPFDEARRLALAVGGLDVDELVRAKILEKKSGTVVLLPPAKRIRRRTEAEATLPGIHAEVTTFPVVLDAVHTVMYLADVDGLAAAKALIDRAGLATDSRFLAALQGLVNAIPRTKLRDEWVRAEAGTLDALCAAYFPDIILPAPAGVFEIPELFPEA